MQPDLRAPEREEKQPDSLDLQEITQPRLSVVTEAAPFESVPAIEPASPPATSVLEKKRSKLNIPAILLGAFVFILLAAVGGLGYWGFTLRTELIATRGQLAALQGEHGQLQTDYATLTSEHEKLKADLTQSQADLEKANTDLTTAQAGLKATQADLEKSQAQIKSLHSQIDKASKLAEVLYGWTTYKEPSDIFKIDTLVKNANDQQLITHWDDLTRSPSSDAFGKFFEFLIGYIRVTLK